jgi:hypothetical protein
MLTIDWRGSDPQLLVRAARGFTSSVPCMAYQSRTMAECSGGALGGALHLVWRG